ncbi:MAG: Nif3-like dinuclear metal center hexameric protein [Deltaproteobacteria bacterium]|nr:Nif3-like dinuclear metal center hexameric protein [Deltaproteobacteria bacterium]
MADLEAITEYLDSVFKPYLFDDIVLNGLQIKCANKQVKNVGLSVDVTGDILAKAGQKEVGLLISHHGLLTREPGRFDLVMSKRLNYIFTNNINIYACHLPMDAHFEFGHSHVLAKMLELADPKPFPNENIPYGCYGRWLGTAKELENKLDEILGTRAKKVFRFSKKGRNPKVAIVSGSGTAFLNDAFSLGINFFITGEPRYSGLVYAKDAQISVFCYGHYQTETLGLYELANHLKSKFDLNRVEVLHSFIDF